MDQKDSTSSLVVHVKSVFEDIHDEPYPKVVNPPNCEKRASVALILRIRPVYPNQADSISKTCKSSSWGFHARLDDFFQQSWVLSGDPEILFIRRAARKGDRWTSHVALPGGKRDPGDEDDQATSVRETMEEIGLDLAAETQFLSIGELPERIVTTSWGKVPYVGQDRYNNLLADVNRLMVLCPFVYLLTNPECAALRLQPLEVSSVHWVSLRALLSPAMRTFQHCDVSDRLTRQGGYVVRSLLRTLLGQMLFSAVRLVPTESLFCSTVPNFIPGTDTNRRDDTKANTKTIKWLSRFLSPPINNERPLLLWGLTGGIVADFLNLLPPYSALELWTWPTFSTWDVQLITWLVTYNFRKRKRQRAASNGDRQTAVIEEGLDAISGPGLGIPNGNVSRRRQLQSSAVGHMIEGYYDLVRIAVFISLVLRLGICSTFVIFLVRRHSRLRFERQRRPC
ncbi:hypothetical protein MMC06_005263 [Schaereria dolodes]|nr:hypothetical protein [Schaereria dolodes]